MITLYRPGTSLLHRAPASGKLALLVVVSFALALAPASLWTIGAALLLIVVTALAAHASAATVARELRAVWLIVLVTLLVQLIFLPPLQAATTTARVAALIVAAAFVTRTTKADAIVAVIERVLAPLARLGVRTDRVGLAVVLAIAAVPQLAAFQAQIRDAQRARGVRAAPWRQVVPLLVLALKHADDVGDALVARGLD